MKKIDRTYYTFEFSPWLMDDVFINVNTYGKDINYCVYELVWRGRVLYVGRGRYWINKPLEYNITYCRATNHKGDAFCEFVNTHINEYTIRVVAAGKTMEQVKALESHLIDELQPVLNKRREIKARLLIPEYLNVNGNNTGIAA